jgi:hypothetical protein
MFIMHVSVFADTYNPNKSYVKNEETTITINGVLVTVVYLNDSPSSNFNPSTPYDPNNGWLWSISKNYTGEWVPYHYALFADKPTTVTFSGFTYKLTQEVWPSAPNPSAATWAWTCLNCSQIVTCSNSITTDYFPIALAKQNNGKDNTTPPNASGGAGIVAGQDGNFLNINQIRSCNTPLALYNNDIYFRDGCDPHAGLGYYGIADNTNVSAPQKRLFADNDTDGPVLYGWKGGALGIRQRTNVTATNGPHIEKIALQWTPSDVILGKSTLPMNLKTWGPIYSYNIQDNKSGIVFSGTDKARIISVTNTAANTTVFRLYGNGDMKAKKIWAESIEVIPQMIWPDYVFKQNYSLRSLYDVELFINSNYHLPDVPSEQEVAEQGINVANMNAILLKKIEELTLYLIDMQKQLDATNAELEKLKK